MLPILFIAALSQLTFAQEQPLSNQEKAAHLFDRLAFGARPGDVEKLQTQGAAGIDRWIHEQLNPASINDSDLDGKLAEFKSLKLSIPELRKQYVNPREFVKDVLKMDPKDIENNEEMRKEVRKKIGEEHLPERIDNERTEAKIIRAVESRKQLQEVLMEFWFNHFNVDSGKGEDRWFTTAYERDAIRPHIFGKFKDLLSATAHHPAMLFYLDNFLSAGENIKFQPKRPNVQGLNENYGRELLELHTLGVDGGYTQNDVREAAKALTGWSIDQPNQDSTFKFREMIHDVSEKHIMGLRLPAGQGIEDGEQLIDYLSKSTATAKFIATKLCRYFVADQPPPKLVQKVAQRFLKSGGDLKAVYLEIFKSPEFWSRKYLHAKIKTPFQYVVSSVRALGGELEVKSDVAKVLNQMGEQLYRCPPPTGYKDDAESWVNPGALVARLNFGLGLAANRVNGAFVQLPHFEQIPRDPKKLVQKIEDRILHRPMGKKSEEVVLKEFQNEGRTMADGEVRPLSLAKAVGLVLGSPEFQRR